MFSIEILEQGSLSFMERDMHEASLANHVVAKVVWVGLVVCLRPTMITHQGLHWNIGIDLCFEI